MLVPIAPNALVMSDSVIAKVRVFEKAVQTLPQMSIHTNHVLHGGMYARTIIIPPNVVLTGAYIKIPTICITYGDMLIYTDGEPLELVGYHVIPATAKRKTALYARAESHFTMLFPTKARTVGQAEKQFTNEVDALSSRLDGSDNFTLITGE